MGAARRGDRHRGGGDACPPRVGWAEPAGADDHHNRRSFGLLAVVLKTMPVGIVYAIWSAVGVALVAVLGKVLFDDPVPPLAMVGMVLIVGGVALVSLSGAPGH